MLDPQAIAAAASNGLSSHILVFSCNSEGANNPMQACRHVVQINQAGGVDCWSDCLAEAQATPRQGVRLTADATATGSWVQLARLQEQAFVNPTVGMVSPVARLALLTASAQNKPVSAYLLPNNKLRESKMQVGTNSLMRTSSQ